MEQKKVPIEGIVYERYNPFLNRSIYIREIPNVPPEGQKHPPGRKYPDEIRRFDKRFLVGIYDWGIGQALDIVYSFDDQYVMWEKVIDNFVRLRERTKHLGKWAKRLYEYSEMGLIKSPWSGGSRTKENLAKIRRMLRELKSILEEYSSGE